MLNHICYMRRRIIVPFLIGLALILSTFISTASIVQKIAYAQARTEPSSSGVPVTNSMTRAVVGSNAEPGRNSVVQGLAGTLSSASIQMTSAQHPIVDKCLDNPLDCATVLAYLGGLKFAACGIMKFKQYRDDPTQVPTPTPCHA